MEVLADAERALADNRLDDVHETLLRATTELDEPPRERLTALGGALAARPLDGLDPRPRVALRLLAADAVDAAWAVLRDNAVGVVEESFEAATSSGARRTSWRLPVSTLVEPPKVYAWLPGLRDPRYAAPDAAYDITDLVTAGLQLDEMWWDRGCLELAGATYLRHLDTSPDDEVEVVFTHADGGPPVVVRGERVRRPDLVRGTGEQLTQRAWAGWSASCDPRALRRPGLWKPSVRVTQQGITGEARLAPRHGDTVRGGQRRAGLRRVVTRFSDDQWLDVLVVDPLALRAPRQVLHMIAARARRR